MTAIRTPDPVRRRGERIFLAIRDRKRGYSVNRKALAAAYFIEAAIIGAGFFAGLEFANRYASGETTTKVAALDWLTILPADAHNQAWWMAIIATIAVSVAELARVPLVQAFCTNRSLGKKLVMLVGALMMCVVTTKTMSQVMEQMFHPRLRFVQEASLDLMKAESRLEMVRHEESSANSALGPLNDDVRRIDEQILSKEESLRAMGPQPKAVCTNAVYGKRMKSGRRQLIRGARCTQPEWPGKTILAALDHLQAEKAEAVGKRDAAQRETAAKTNIVAAEEAAMTVAAGKHQKAVSESQLHSFTAMVFGKDPVQVSDAEVHWFLRIFVFVPAIMIALASSLLAASAYTRVRQAPDPILLTINRPLLAPAVKEA